MSTPPVPDSRASSIIQPWMYIVGAIIFIQFGASVAKQLFDEIGFASVVFLRTFLGSLFFLSLARPRFRSYNRRVYLHALFYGATIAANMLIFYAAMERIPLGITVAIAFCGPLVVSVLGSRRPIDFLWIALAALGILLLSPITGTDLDPVGVLLAFICSGAWATYILIAKRASSLLPGNTMLALAMTVAALVAAPFGAVGVVGVLASPSLLLLALLVALFSSIIPFWLEFRGIRHLEPRVFALLMSLEPAAAALMGWVVLHENLGGDQLIGIGMVTIAAIATTRTSKPAAHADLVAVDPAAAAAVPVEPDPA